MSDPFEVLRGELVAAAGRADGHRIVRAQWRRRLAALRRPSHPLAIAFALCAVGAGAAAATVALVGQRSAPLSGSVPGQGNEKALAWNEAGRRYRVVFSPILSGGEAGWSETTLIGSSGTPQDAGLGVVGGGYPSPSEPVVAANTYGGGVRRAHGDLVQWLLTAGNVAAVRVGGLTIKTRATTDIPAGDRVAVFFVPASWPPIIVPPPGTKLPYYLNVPAGSIGPGGRMRVRRERAITPVALDAQGHVIAPAPPPPRPLPASVRSWHAKPQPGGAPGTPTSQQAGACTIGSGAGSGATALWGSVVTAVDAVPDTSGELLLSCANVEFRYDGWPTNVALLVNARHPGSPPGPIPGTTPVGGHPGYFAGDDIAARRIGNAWLLAIGGRSGASSLALLATLSIGNLELAPRPVSPAARLVARARTCFARAGLHALVGTGGPSPAPYNMEVSSGASFTAFADVYDSTAAALAGLPYERWQAHRTPRVVRRGAVSEILSGTGKPAKLERRGAVTVILMAGGTAAQGRTLARCFPG